MIYLASPYSHPDAGIREQRYRAACRAVAELTQAGQIVISPVIHSHPLTEFGLPTGWNYWQRTDLELLKRCDELVVLKLEGWEASVGVTAEIRSAEELGKPVRHLDPSCPAGSQETVTSSSPRAIVKNPYACWLVAALLWLTKIRPSRPRKTCKCSNDRKA